ncbi:DUF3572 domain-containing protein [Jiella pelagia]|uniref:DUF3572 domain-containing protein n=1 Tax=Jiella pelagia TaxID=2986949 RepID=A0ABY7BZP9_9HYPH|nr:DUF3572 domain-containing protein [Jiella pelagia]WAP68903.1 DUF3572 domain-containing protein [Jiella pelagia]
MLDAETAETIAIQGLTFIAADPVLWPRFLAITGIDQSQLRDAARARGFLPGVLDFILAHRPTLDAFCAAQELRQQSVSDARQLLNGPEDVIE